MDLPDLLATCWTTAGDAVPMDGRDGSPLELDHRVRAAAAAGFSGFGLVHNDLETYLRDHSLEDLHSLFEDHGMRHVELEFLTHWWLPEGPERAEHDRLLEVLLRACEVLQPHHVKVGPDITGGEFHLEPYAESWHRTASSFADVGTVIALEFMPFSNIPTLAEARQLVETAGHRSGGLMVDTWHIMRGGEHQLAEMRDLPLWTITGVEVDDGDEQQVGTAYEDTVLRRRIPGQGDWPVHEFIAILQDLGWSGPWGVEILSETYRVRPLEESLPEVVSATLAEFDRAADLRASRGGEAR